MRWMLEAKTWHRMDRRRLGLRSRSLCAPSLQERKLYADVRQRRRRLPRGVDHHALSPVAASRKTARTTWQERMMIHSSWQAAASLSHIGVQLPLL